MEALSQRSSDSSSSYTSVSSSSDSGSTSTRTCSPQTRTRNAIVAEEAHRKLARSYQSISPLGLRPKFTNSPSVSAFRKRHLKSKNKTSKPFAPPRSHFPSDMTDDGHSFSNDDRNAVAAFIDTFSCDSNHLEDITEENVLNDSTIEVCFLENTKRPPARKRRGVVTLLGDPGFARKSVLKKSSHVNRQEKKHVHFHLPAITSDIDQLLNEDLSEPNIRCQ